MAINIKYIIHFANLLIFVFTIACNNKTEKILEIIYQDTLLNFQSKSSSIINDSTITFHYDITNMEKQNIYFPIGFFYIQSSILGSDYLTTFPLKTYIFHTLSIYPRNTELRFLTDMNKGELTEFMPVFIRIKTHESLNIKICFPIVFKNNENIEKRFIDSLEYSSKFKIAIIKQDKFINILKMISKDKEIEKFVLRKDTLSINSHTKEMIFIESFPLSNIKIDEFQSLVINEMCNIKYDIICDIKNLNKDEIDDK